MKLRKIEKYKLKILLTYKLYERERDYISFDIDR